MSMIEPASARLEREAALWRNYVSAKSRADETRGRDDRRAADQAWRAFLELSETAAQSVIVRKSSLLTTYNPQHGSSAE